VSLNAALNIGRSGLAASQAAITVAGNNLANSANGAYTRQSPNLVAGTDVQVSPGIFIGTGVTLQNIIRNVDNALNDRLRAAVADQSGSQARLDLLSQIESIEAELSDTSLSGKLNDFFNTFSELANNPSDASLRSLVTQQGSALSGQIQSMRNDMIQARNQLDDQIRGSVNQVNSLLEQIATLNGKIVTAEAGAGGANGMRDQRDQLIDQVSEYIDVSTINQSSGSTDVFLNGIPLVAGGTSRGVTVDYATSTDTSELNLQLRVADDGTFLTANSGSIGAMMTARDTDMLPAIAALDDFSAALIWQVNRVHSQGAGSTLFDSLTSASVVTDPAASLTSGASGLDFAPSHGSFDIYVTQKSTGTATATRINVDGDGIGGPDSSLNDIAAQLNAVGNLSATVTADGHLRITSDSGDFQFSFAADSSGFLAALGLNTYFTGHNATDIAVNDTLLGDPTKLATGANRTAGDNGTALAIAALRSTPLDELGGLSLPQMWTQHVEDFAVRTSQAKLSVQSDQSVVDSLTSQKQSISGVSVDEESINLMAYQRAYQASARFITVVNQMMDTLMTMVQ